MRAPLRRRMWTVLYSLLGPHRQQRSRQITPTFQQAYTHKLVFKLQTSTAFHSKQTEETKMSNQNPTTFQTKEIDRENCREFWAPIHTTSPPNSAPNRPAAHNGPKPKPDKDWTESMGSGLPTDFWFPGDAAPRAPRTPAGAKMACPNAIIF